MRATTTPEICFSTEVVTYYWQPGPGVSLREHCFSSVFPSSSEMPRSRTPKSVWPSRQLCPVVLAHGEIVVGGDIFRAMLPAGEPIYVIDLGKASPSEVKRWVATVNHRRPDISYASKRLAAETLIAIAQGTMKRQEAEAICGLAPSGFKF
jgi:hypothetical protein